MGTRPRRRKLRWFLVAGTAGLSAAALALVGTVGWLQTRSGRAFLATRLEAAVTGALSEGTFTVGEIRTDLFRRIALRDAVLRDADGTPIVHLGAADLRLRLLDLLLARRLTIADLRVDGVTVDLHTDGGRLNLARLFPPPDPDAPPSEGGLPVDLEIRAVTVTDVDLRYDGFHLRDVDLTATIVGSGDRLVVAPLALTGSWTAPVDGPLAVSGALDLDGDEVSVVGLRLMTAESVLSVDGTVSLADETALALAVDVPRLDLHRLDPLLGNAGFVGTWAGTVGLDGPLSSLGLRATLDGLGPTRGGLDLDARLDLTADRLTWRLGADLRELHLDDLLAPVTTAVALTGRADLHGAGTTWPDDVRLQGRFEGSRQQIADHVLHALSADFRLDGGVVSLDRFAVHHDAAALTGQGTLDVVRGPLDLTLAGAIHPEGLSTVGVTGLSGHATVDLHLVGDLFADVPIPAFSGRFSADDLVWDDTIAVAALRGAVEGRIDANGTALDLSLDGRGIRAPGVAIDRIADEAVSVRIFASGDTEISGTATHAAGLVSSGVADVERADGSWQVRIPGTGPWAVEASVVVGAFDLLGFPGTGGVVDVWVDPRAVDFDVYLTDGPRPVLRTIGGYDLAEATVALAGLSLAPVPGATWEAGQPLTMRLVDGGVADASVTLGSPHGEIAFTGDLGTSAPLDAAVSVADLDLAYVARLFPGLGPLDGHLDLEATLTGTGQNARIAATSTGRASAGARPPVTWTARVDAADGVADLNLTASLDDAPLGHLTGTLPVRLDPSAPGLDPDGPVDLRLTVAPGPFSRFGRLALQEVPDGRVSATLTARGLLHDPDLDLALVADVPLEGLDDPTRIELVTSRRGPDLRWWVDALDGHSLAASFDGVGRTDLGRAIAWSVGAEETPPDWGDPERFVRDLDAHLTLHGLPAATLGRLAGFPGILQGLFTGGVTLTGTPVRPRLAGDVSWTDAAIADVPVADAVLSLAEDDPGLLLDAHLAFDEAGTFDLSGAIPVEIDLTRPLSTWSRGDLDLTLDGRDLPFAAIVPFLPGAHGGGGTLDLSGRVGGPLHDPLPTLRATLAGGNLAYAPLGLNLSDFGFVATLDRAGLSVTDLEVHTHPWRRGLDLTEEAFAERIAGGLSVALEGWSPTDVSGRFTLDGAWVLGHPDLQVRATGGIDLSGSLPALRITGDLSVDNALIVQDLASFLEVGPLTLDDRITVERPRLPPPERPAEAASEDPGVWESMTVAVDVDLARNVEIQVAFPFFDDLGAIGASLTRADVTARLGGALTYGLEGGVQSLRGPVDVIDGTVRVLQTTFDLDGGTATFHGDLYDPIVDLAATSTIGDASVDLEVTGTAERPSVAFSSDQYPDQTQILTLLITGRAPDELSSDQGTAAAQALLGLVVSSVLSGARLGSLSYDPDGTLRVGLPVARNVYLETALATQASLGENQFVGDLEWQIARKFVVNVAIGNRFSWMDLLWETRF